MDLYLITIGVISGILLAGIVYTAQVLIKMELSKKKIKNVLEQIRGQVDVKYSLLSEYIDINKEDMDYKKYTEIKNSLSLSLVNVKDIDSLKDLNAEYAYYMHSFNDTLLDKQCDESEKRIDCLKGYYNELVSYHNQYKSNKFNSLVARVAFIEDEQLY